MLKTITEKVAAKVPVTAEEALWLLTKGELLALGRLADSIRQRLHPERCVSFVVDRNVNYTNVCE